ncbi:lipopolysaccharide biosynthesis protein [Echinicola strongylocentroti]|uniref:Lipopolysaccharide biosynthesis protein n=1 Tax=Echinicola strongylocentroti TaxID=1795355 RepID=A0A2Z4IPE9_9BACT|nr:lipopolysaccharide biosynthesis protein [Echinicola strongylocentroti]AWW32579.1 lipopolysaccharide biosynthesis protein [Echinicola strongylocentroti]
MEAKKIVSGVKWTSIQFVIGTAFRFSIKLILAKLLLPEEFGLVGMCSIFIAVASAASEIGMSAALIQRENDDEVLPMYSTAFWTGIGWGLVVFAIMSVLIGPFAANFYGQPRLIQLIPVLSIGILIKPFGMIHTVILTRRMDFKVITKALNIAVLIAGVIAIISGFLGAGVWALVVNNALAPILALPTLFSATNWKPKIEWKKDQFKSIFGFGAYSSGTQIFSTLTYNVDNLLIGKMLGSSLLGTYTLAFSLTEQVRQTVSSVLNKVMYPVFGKHQQNKGVLRKYFLNIVHLNAIMLYPLMGFMMLFANEIVLFFGAEWVGAVIPLQLLSLAIMIHLMVNSFGSIIRGIGKPKLEMKIIMGLTCFILIPGLIIGITKFGLVGAAVAILINKLALSITGMIVLKKHIGLSAKELLGVLVNPVLAVAISSVCVYILKNTIANVGFFIPAVVFLVISYGSIVVKEKDNLFKLVKLMA